MVFLDLSGNIRQNQKKLRTLSRVQEEDPSSLAVRVDDSDTSSVTKFLSDIVAVEENDAKETGVGDTTQKFYKANSAVKRRGRPCR